jgi:hypothetical protein
MRLDRVLPQAAEGRFDQAARLMRPAVELSPSDACNEAANHRNTSRSVALPVVAACNS